AWLQRRCALEPGSQEMVEVLNSAWEALEPIARRVSGDMARHLMMTAVSHPYWTTMPFDPNAVFTAKKQMVETVTHLVYSVPISELDTLARQTAPLAKERMQSYDYPGVINLLCHIADRGGKAVKEWVGDQLFPLGQPVTYLVGQVAATFG